MTVSPTLLSVSVSWTRFPNFDAFAVFLSNGSMIRRLASLHWLQLGAVRQLLRYYQDAMTPCCRPAALRFLRLAVPLRSLVVFAPWRTSEPPRPGVGNPVSPAGNSPRSEQGSPKFLGNLNYPFANVPIRRRQDCSHQTIAMQQRGPWSSKGKGSHDWVFRRSIALLSDSLSTLRSVGYPWHRARLASSCWSGSSGRDFHPQGSAERFQSC